MTFTKGTTFLFETWSRAICNALGRSYYEDTPDDIAARAWIAALLHEAINVGALRYDPSNTSLDNSFLVVEDPERLEALFAAIEAHYAREDLEAL